MANRTEFVQGVVYAAARLIETFDQPTLSLEIVDTANINRDDLKQCAEYDLAFLRKEDPTIPTGI